MPRARHFLIWVIAAFGLCPGLLRSAEADSSGAGNLKPSTGEALARVYCGSCHTFPTPDLLDKKTWREQTLPRMSIRLGLAPEQIDKHPEAALLWASGVFPTSPMISGPDWDAQHHRHLV